VKKLSLPFVLTRTVYAEALSALATAGLVQLPKGRGEIVRLAIAPSDVMMAFKSASGSPVAAATASRRICLQILERVL
jgi:DNA-binding FadR family transcriptional regulator